MSTHDIAAEKESGFDPLYEGRAPIEGLGLSFRFAPWDIGGPQPVVMELEAAAGFGDAVLDAGCGRGEHAIYLAGRGHRVTGVDSSSAAIEQAGERARAAGADVEFTVGEATRLDALPGRFDTVLDYGLYHCLPADAGRQYAEALHRICEPAARVQLFCFSETAPPGMPPAALRVAEDALRADLAGLWTILGIEEKRSVTSFTREFLVKQRDNAPGGLEFDIDALEEDDTGRILLPIWHVTAERI
ncbi:class I SAM-dependent methyltransferase [Actinomadura meridiana]|uniref:Class I SAM-dependent methyltransferase n=1 Tax=Actinomadura meridiana TaxID=559626 RepID=A0ABP8BS56_9ACTN